jgi:DNA-binding winged helix-turn-helix (wHTH) protein/lipopolysaccharide biosynthesis regulator YciM
MLADSPRGPAAYTFGCFRLDPARRRLFSGQESISLPERTFQLLLLLIQAAGDVVSKETLAAKVWPETTVTDGNLSQHIYLLRQTLGERAKDRSYIMTVPGKGFRFAAPVAVASAVISPDQVEPVPSSTATSDDMLGGGLETLREYCRGSQLLERRTAANLWAAIEAFENAIRMNVAYMPALVGLARAYAALAELGHVPAKAAFQKARKAIARALNVEPSCAGAHAALSEILLFSWDWDGARKELEYARRLNPASAFVRSSAALLSICEGAHDKARIEVQRALMLDPSSRRLLLLFSQALIHAGEFHQAIPCLSSLIELEPAFHIARRYRAQAYLLAEEPAKAIRDLQPMPQERAEDPAFRLPMLSRAFADYGDAVRARELHEKLLEMSSTNYVGHWNVALSAIGIGEEEEAMLRLERAFDEGEPSMVFLKNLHWFTKIEKSPRFKKLLSEIGGARDGGRTVHSISGVA